jgi:hypothetical protein
LAERSQSGSDTPKNELQLLPSGVAGGHDAVDERRVVGRADDLDDGLAFEPCLGLARVGLQFGKSFAQDRFGNEVHWRSHHVISAARYSRKTILTLNGCAKFTLNR